MAIPVVVRLCFQPRFSKMSFSSAQHGESLRATHIPRSCKRILVRDPILAARKERVLIPTDIIVEILRRLPAKHILRFRAVCKSWYSLTYEHHFISEHWKNNFAANDIGIISLSQSQPSAAEHELSIHYYVNGFHKFDIRNLFVCLGELRTEISTPCDGLVCVYGRESVCVVNPSIKEALLLPKTKNKARANVALGKSISTGEYKVIRLFRRRDKSIGCEIFNPGSHSWRLIKDPPLVGIDASHVVVNGIVHWMANSNAKWALVSFDIESENFDVIYPPMGFFRNAYAVLNELGGHICVTVTPARSIFSYGQRSYKHVWILEDYENLIWKKHHISTQHIKSEVAFCKYPVMIRDGKLLFQGRSGRFIYYDLKSRRFMTPMIAVHGNDNYNGRAYPYKESLVSPIDIHVKKLTTGELPLRVALKKESRGVWGRLAFYYSKRS